MLTFKQFILEVAEPSPREIKSANEKIIGFSGLSNNFKTFILRRGKNNGITAENLPKNIKLSEFVNLIKSRTSPNFKKFFNPNQGIFAINNPLFYTIRLQYPEYLTGDEEEINKSIQEDIIDAVMNIPDFQKRLEVLSKNSTKDSLRKEVIRLTSSSTVTPFPESHAKYLKMDSNTKTKLLLVEDRETAVDFCHKYGMKASWCISYENTDSHWNNYTGKGISFVFVLLEDGNKYAIAFAPDKNNWEIYNKEDQLTSSFYLVTQHPEIVNPLKRFTNGSFKSQDEFDAKPKVYSGGENGWEVVEMISGALGGGGYGKTAISYLDENKKLWGTKGEGKYPAYKMN